MLSSEVPGGHRGREVILTFVIAKLNAVGDTVRRFDVPAGMEVELQMSNG